MTAADRLMLWLGGATGLILGVGLTWVLPRLTPPAPSPTPVPASPPRNPVSARTPRKPASPPAVIYAPAELVSVRRLGKSLGFLPWLPVQSREPLQYDTSYRLGRVLYVALGPVFVAESLAPIPAEWIPAQKTAIALPNGTTGERWWVPGDGGSAWRLDFREGAVFLRVAVSGVDDTIGGMRQLAAGFRPLSQIGSGV